MSGIEIAVGVAGIVTAIVKVAQAVRKFRNERANKRARIDRNAETAESRLITTLDNGPPQISNEYDRNLVRIGPAFSRGDEISSHALMSILVTMNSSLVNIIHGFLAAGRVAFAESDYNSWNSVGATTTRDTVNTLAQLYQRKLQSAPIQKSRIQYVEDLEEVKNLDCENGLYTGQMKNGELNGWGVLKFDNGDHYEGGFKDGQIHGFGRMEWRAFGDAYEGVFCYGKKSGKGKLTLRDGTTYDGCWEDNRKGTGTVAYPSGVKISKSWSLALDSEGQYYDI